MSCSYIIIQLKQCSTHIKKCLLHFCSLMVSTDYVQYKTIHSYNDLDTKWRNKRWWLYSDLVSWLYVLHACHSLSSLVLNMLRAMSRRVCYSPWQCAGWTILFFSAFHAPMTSWRKYQVQVTPRSLCLCLNFGEGNFNAFSRDLDGSSLISWAILHISGPYLLDNVTIFKVGSCQCFVQ